MLTELWNKLKNAMTDIATLDVVTASGVIDIKKALDDNNNVDFTGLMDAIKAGGAPAAPATPGKESSVSGTADLSILAISHLELDCDAFMFVKGNLSESEQSLVSAHAEMVKAAQETRYGVVKMAIELFKGKAPTAGS